DEDGEAQRHEQHRHDGAQFRGGKRRVEKRVSPSPTRSGPAHGEWSFTDRSIPFFIPLPQYDLSYHVRLFLSDPLQGLCTTWSAPFAARSYHGYLTKRYPCSAASRTAT